MFLKKKIIFVFINACLVSFFPLAGQSQSINPLSKIVITSHKAICQKDPINAQLFMFNYLGNVKVVFADNSTITADSLEVLFDGKAIEKTIKTDPTQTTTQHKNSRTHTNTTLSQFKKIIFKNNVDLINQNRTFSAQKAELNLIENNCKLEGNVCIAQQKASPKDLPISIESQEAMINLTTNEITFQGSYATPVSTTISLNEYEPLQKKSIKKIKKHKHRHE